MPNISAKVGPLPVWGWAALGLVVAVWVRHRQKAAQTATQLPTQSLNPDYGPGGWPGQGSLGAIPFSAASTTAFQPPTTSSTSSAAGKSSATLGPTTPLQILANSGQPPGRFLPR